MIDYLTVLNVKEFSFQSMMNETEKPPEKILVKNMLMEIKKFFERREMSPCSSYMVNLVNFYEKESVKQTALELIYTISFLCKDGSMLLTYPQNFFINSFYNLNERFNAVNF